MSTRPKVSITMPVLNGERYIAEAIGSIAAQTYRDFELIVVDDGSTDGTAACVEAFRDKLALKYVKHTQNQGIARSVNDGLRHSSGEFVAFLDHDDRWLPDFLETQVAYLESHPDVTMVHADHQIIDTDGKVVCESVGLWDGKDRPSGYIFPQLFQQSFIVGNSVLIRKPCLEELGGFDERLRFGDYHLWMRMALKHKIDYVSRPLTQYRQHVSQHSRAAAVVRPEDSLAIEVTQKILAEYPEARAQLGKTVIRRRFASEYFDLAYSSFLAGAFANARACVWKAIQMWPWNPRYYLLLMGVLLPPGLGREMRRSWRRVRGLGKERARQSETPANDRATEAWR
jgi:glycosyltransferase involved in cell wall biosynthesis